MEINEFDKCLKTLERVKGIEPSYSAWKAAALPLSYTRAQGINYHATLGASTVQAPICRPRGPCSTGGRGAGSPLNMRLNTAYTKPTINNERR
jgi:hypothetical protein